MIDGGALSAGMAGGLCDPCEHLIRMYPAIVPPPISHIVMTAEPLIARINHGIWIASCPCGAKGLPTPGGIVFLDTPLIWCARCQNGAVGRGWRRVIVPPEPTRRQIEAILLCRPNIENRNWEPTESIDDLLAQNRDHGDPVPDLSIADIGPVHGPDWRDIVTPFSPLIRAARAGGTGLRRLMGRR